MNVFGLGRRGLRVGERIGFFQFGGNRGSV